MAKPDICGSAALLGTASAFALLVTTPVWAQDGASASASAPAPDAPPAEEEIVVRGIRAAQESSQLIKRDAAQIVDAITAEDVGKLPDQNIAESLQRITGVQIQRDLGEGSGVSVRGLTQNRFEVDGATLTGNDTGRGVNFESIPSELYSGIRVYKSPTASQVEGSLGALIRLTTLRPLDLSRKDPILVAGSAQAAYSEYRNAWDPTLSGMIAGRFDTAVGEIGAVLSLSYQRRSLRNDYMQVIAWDRTTFGDLNGNGVVESAPTGPLTPDEVYRARAIRQVTQLADRKRIGGLGTVQWRPGGGFELRATANYLEYSQENDYRQLQFATNRPNTASSAVTITPDRTLSAATITGTAFSTQNFSIPTTQTNFNGQLELDWKSSDNLHMKLLGTIGRGRNKPLLRIFPVLQQRTGQTLQYDFGAGTGLPTVAIPNFDFSNLANYAANTVATQRRDPRNDDNALLFDVDYAINSGWLKSVEAGARYSNGGVDFDFYRTTSAKLLGRPATTLETQLPPGAFALTFPGGADFMEGFSGNVPRGWVTYSPEYLRGPGGEALLALAGLDPNAVPLDYTASWKVHEKTYAGYVQANFDGDLGSMPVRGNIGVRYVKTDSVSTGYFPQSGTNFYLPELFERHYGDWLPSANLTIYPAQDFLVRFAAAKVMSRPAFTQLSAATTFMPAQAVATAGNPFLDPFRATQADVSFEWYYGRGDIVSLALFYKDVAAFITTETVSITGPDMIGGTQAYLLTRPANGRNGKIKGFEFNLEHNFVELPAPLDGFGIRANYTFVDSNTPDIDDITGETLPIPGLSRNSYNLVGFYEKYGFQARISYNWRSDFISGTFAGRPIFTKGNGRLDASLGYDLTRNIALTVEAINLTKARDFNYFVLEERPLQIGINDRRFLFGVRGRF